jgi:hypothetical protein
VCKFDENLFDKTVFCANILTVAEGFEKFIIIITNCHHKFSFLYHTSNLPAGKAVKLLKGFCAVLDFA